MAEAPLPPLSVGEMNAKTLRCIKLGDYKDYLTRARIHDILGRCDGLESQSCGWPFSAYLFSAGLAFQ